MNCCVIHQKAQLQVGMSTAADQQVQQQEVKVRPVHELWELLKKAVYCPAPAVLGSWHHRLAWQHIKQAATAPYRQAPAVSTAAIHTSLFIYPLLHLCKSAAYGKTHAHRGILTPPLPLPCVVLSNLAAVSCRGCEGQLDQPC